MDELPNTLTPVENVVWSSQPTDLSRLPWGRLLPCKSCIRPVDLIDDSFSFGRAEDCTVMVTSQQFNCIALFNISKKHFSIERSVDDNLVYITDLSKNGTFVNRVKLGKGNKKILKSDDIIAITSESHSLYIFTYKGSEGIDSCLPQVLLNKYAHIKQLGRGSCGEVRLVRDRDTFINYAIKKILVGESNTSQIHKINHPTKIRNEIEILKALTHPCIIGMNDIVLIQNEVYIILEYMAGGELTNRIVTAEHNFTEDNAKFFFFQILLAVYYLHLNGVVHRDLKPENILLQDNREETVLKIGDFGLSKITNNTDMTTMCGTLRYVAPEVINKDIREYGEYGKEVDIWSMGVILFFMLSKEYPFCANDLALIRRQIITGSYSFNSEIWSQISTEAKDLVKKMLKLQPKRRIKLNEIFNHPWIKNDYGVKRRVEKLLQQEGYTNPMDYLVQEPPEKKFKFTFSSSSSESESTLLCTSRTFNSTVVC